MWAQCIYMYMYCMLSPLYTILHVSDPYLICPLALVRILAWTCVTLRMAASSLNLFQMSVTWCLCVSISLAPPMRD